VGLVATPFTIYVMQSAHNDIGFTHPREQIMLMYLDHYDRVLDLCRQTADAPEAHRFKWTCEVAWQVHHYLAARPEREEEFVRHVRTGQIELTAAYLHFTDLVDADLYGHSLDWAAAFARRHGLPLRCAVHSDINGWPWAAADLLAERDVPFFCSHVHIDSATDPLGRRGSVHYHWTREMEGLLRPDAPVRIPRAFWWQGPRGGRVLHWLGEHYLLGNVLGLSSPASFHAEKTRYFPETDQLTADDLYARASDEVPRYVARLRADGYALDALLLSTGGFYTDNAPPDARWLAVIARWNADHGAHDDIRLRTATPGEWYEWLLTQEQESAGWPTRRVAWPDGWAHGLGAQTARIAQARRTQRRRASVAAVVESANVASARALLADALAQEQMALEHTFNAWCAESRPGATINDFEQAAKDLTFHRAAYYLDEAATAAVRALAQPGPRPRLYLHVAEAGDWRTVHMGAGDLRLDPAAQSLLTDAGDRYPFQRESAAGAEEFYVAVLPPERSGLQGITLVPDEPPRDTAVPDGRHGPDDNGLILETAGWRLTFDLASGGLGSLRESASGREWVEQGRPWAFGQLVHEVVVHPAGRSAVGNAARLIALDVASEEARRAFAPGPIVAHATPAITTAPRRQRGPVYDAIEADGAHTEIGRLHIQWRAYHRLPLIELVIDWDKEWSDRPEAAYVAFPFAAGGGELRLETGGGLFRPGSHGDGGQLPGACSSYYTVQRGAHLTTPDGAALCWLPLDAPLVMPNAINFNNWESGEWRWNGFLASMPVNHYWHTNFPTSQRGRLRLRYRILGASGFPDPETALRVGLPLEALGWR